MKVLSLTFVAILSLSTTVNSGFFDNALNLVKPSVSLDSITFDVEFKETTSSMLRFISNTDSAVDAEISATGSIYNKLSNKAISQVQINIKILECDKLGYNCTQVGEEDININTDVPPKQTRYFSEMFSHNRGVHYVPTFYKHKVVKVK